MVAHDDTVQNTMSSLQREMKELEAQKEYHLSKFEEIDYVWRQKKQHFFCLSNQSSLVSSLPNETLAMIFEAGCSLPSSGDSESDSERPFEILVTQITQHWRNVAISSPSLWTKIRITLWGILSIKCDGLSAYLLRSAMLPLDLQIRIRNIPDVTPHITRACQILSPHLGRFRRLFVACHNRDHVFHFFRCLPPVPVTILEHLEVASSETSADALAAEIFPQGLPSLRCARFRGVGIRNCLAHLSTVTYLHIHELHHDMRIDYHELRSALQGFSALTHLVLSGGDVFRPSSSMETDINLDSLLFLHIGTHPDYFSHDVSCVLMKISAPSLQSLVLDSVFSWELEGFFEFLGPKSTKFPSLTSLTIGYGDDTSNPLDWKGLSNAFPTITQLALFYGDTSSFLSFLQKNDDPSPGWPRLQRLILSNRHQEAEMPLICDMVSARIASGCPIRSICLSEFSMRQDVVKDQLEWLRERVTVDQGEISHGFWCDIVGSWSTDETLLVVRILM